jgi:hypothetical protein
MYLNELKRVQEQKEYVNIDISDFNNRKEEFKNYFL